MKELPDVITLREIHTFEFREERSENPVFQDEVPPSHLHTPQTGALSLSEERISSFLPWPPQLMGGRVVREEG